MDSVLLEPNRPQVVRKDLALARWPEALAGFTIAVLSDFHYDAYFSDHPLHAAVPMVNALAADMIVLTGDFVSVPGLGGDYVRAASAAEPCARHLQQMHARYGVWAVLGNHDEETDPWLIIDTLRNAGITVLANQSSAIELKGARFWLSGVSDVLARAADLDTTLEAVPTNEPTVLLVHEPDYADYVARHPVDLQISGHSHGGQVRLPWLPPLYLPDLGRRYVSGIYQIGRLTLYTNRGLGTVGIPVRWNCPPEITLLTVRRGTNS